MQVIDLRQLTPPRDAVQIGPALYLKILKQGDVSRPVEAAPKWLYWHTVYTKDGKDQSTTNEIGVTKDLSHSLRRIVAGAHFGETRRVWACPKASTGRITDYVFDRPISD